MNKGSKVIIAMWLVSTWSLTGCGGFDTNSILQGKSSSSQSESFESLNKEIDQVDSELTTVHSELSKLNLSQISLNPQTSLDKSVEAMFKQLLDAVAKVKVRVESMQKMLKDRLALLDPNVPANLPQISKINEALSYIDQLKNTVNSRLKDIKTRVTDKISLVDAQLAKMDPTKPLTWIASLAWAKVKTVLTEKLSLIDQLVIP